VGWGHRRLDDANLQDQVRAGYGSFALSPPVNVDHLPLPQLGHGGMCWVEPTWSS
jgi:hypothetical protein